MVKTKTTRFGDIEIKDEDLIELPTGIIGFPELNKFILLDHDDNSPFKWLQSVDDGAIAFVLINPLLFKPDYAVEVSEAEVSDLDLHNEEDAIVSVIVTMPSNPENMTANLKAPLIFNLKNRLGKQIILSQSNYNTRHNILAEVRKYTSLQQDEKIQSSIQSMKDDLASQANVGKVGEQDKG